MKTKIKQKQGRDERIRGTELRERRREGILEEEEGRKEKKNRRERGRNGWKGSRDERKE